MSLKLSLQANHDAIIINRGILSVISYPNSVIYSCFAKDVQLNHPLHGAGEIIDYDYKKSKWVCNFDNCSSLQELSTKHLIGILN